MKKLLLYTLLYFCSVCGYAQNLVPNWSFEDYSNCPNMEDQVQYCDGWDKFSTSSSTPDYYNACSPNYFSVPQNQALFQPDHRNCGAYMGLCTWSFNFTDYREQIGIQLTQPFVIGQKYFLSFYTVRAGFIDDSDCPSNNIGMRLSTVAYSSSNPAPIDNFSHLHSTSIINDTTNWIRVTGSIVADSAYQYLMLGNFYDDLNTDTTTLTCGACLNWYSYYLIDDVCISTDSSLCNGGIDALPCIISIKENYFNNQFTFYPNPASNLLTVQSNFNASFDLTIYNSIGQTLYNEQSITTNNLKLDLSKYNEGLLFIKILSKNNQFTYKLLKL